MENEKEEPAPPGYMWVNVRTFVKGQPVTKKELVEMKMTGAPSKPKDPTEEIKKIVEEIKPKIEAEMNATYSIFEPVCFTSQVVAGTNYKIKVKVGDNKYLHIKVFRALPCNGGELRPTIIPGEFKLEDKL